MGVGVDYETEIHPIFNSNCTSYCHTGGADGGLNLESYDGLMAGGDSGEAVFPYYSSASLLIQKLNGTAPGQQMP